METELDTFALLPRDVGFRGDLNLVYPIISLYNLYLYHSTGKALEKVMHSLKSALTIKLTNLAQVLEMNTSHDTIFKHHWNLENSEKACSQFVHVLQCTSF